jgi:hypothetical protein
MTMMDLWNIIMMMMIVKQDGIRSCNTSQYSSYENARRISP